MTTGKRAKPTPTNDHLNVRGWCAHGEPDGKAHGGCELYSDGISKGGSVVLAPNVMFRTKDALGVFTEIGVLAVFSATHAAECKRFLITLCTNNPNKNPNNPTTY